MKGVRVKNASPMRGILSMVELSLFSAKARLVAFDPVATTVHFGDTLTNACLAASSTVTDDSGTRTAVLVFPAGTRAYSVEGSVTQEVDRLTIRVTEFTVGEGGPARMPVELPPTTAYTYCAELPADEASHVVFDRRIFGYVENFVGIPVGCAVPSAFYDFRREVPAWASPFFFEKVKGKGEESMNRQRRKPMNKVTTIACVAALTAASSLLGAAPAELDMRVSKGCYLSVAVDVDAIRAEAPAAISVMKDVIACRGTNGAMRAETAQSTLASIDKAASCLAEVKRECGVGPEDFHWVVLGGCNRSYWMQRDSMQTQFVWGAAISAERLDWKRIESYTTRRGLRWTSDMGVPETSYTVSWFGASGYLAGMIRFGVWDDGMLYPATGRCMYGVYDAEGKIPLDERPSRRGKLEKGEVVRVVLTDFNAIPVFFQMVADIPQFGPALVDVDECRLSLFLLDGKVGARLVVDFADEAKAAAARAKYEADVTMSWNGCIDEIKKELASARSSGKKGKIEVFETLLEWHKELKVSFEGRTLTVDTGRIDERKFFTVFADLLAEFLCPLSEFVN